VKLRLVAAALAAMSLAACATTPTGPRPAPSPLPPEPAPPQPPATERILPLSALPGWQAEDHAAAFAAFRSTCKVSRDPEIAGPCRAAQAAGALAERAARDFLEAQFVAETLPGQGVLTGYYAPVYPARRQPDAEFSAALRARPADLKVVDAGLFDPAQAGRSGAAIDPGFGPLLPYPDRANIEATPAQAPLAWMRPEDLFFLQIQGSGALVFEDGARMKALYAANNGRPFVGIANIMRDRGLLAPDNTSGEAIHAWLAAHRGPDADALMQLNPRYAFFRLAPDDGRAPVGAAGVPLPAGRAVAVDRKTHAMGELLWIDGEAPLLQGAFPAYRRLVMALDTGGAIEGPVRADLYLGEGEAAGAEAGRVRHVLRLYRLAPRTVAGIASAALRGAASP
jgi:membrane-bound lytic murein transglycosylase A